MKKKTYKQPKMKVAVLEQTDMLCTSQYDVTPHNESYEEEDEQQVNSLWYN